MATADASARTIYDQLATRAAERGERQVAAARLLGCAALAARNGVMHAPDIAQGQLKELVALAVFASGAIVSGLILSRRLERLIPSLRARLVLSISFDAALLAIIMLMIVLQPEATYTGLLRMPYMLAYAMVLAILPLRMSQRLVALGAALNMGLLAAALALDAHLHGARQTYGGAEVTFVFIALGILSMMMALTVDRLRALVLASAAEAQANERARAALGAYLSAEVAQAALADEQLVLGGRRQPVAVLFSDLRGFTTLSESLDPQELVAQLNAYFQVMVEAIEAEGGVVDKYIGDAIMAVFGAPTTRQDDAARALRAALRMEQALLDHNAQRAAQGLAPLAQGVGLHYGEVIAGNIGTLTRAQYTVMGDAVNLAARLESETKARGVTLLASRALLDAALAHDPDARRAWRSLGPLHVKGRAQPVEALARIDDGPAQAAAPEPAATP